MQKLLEAGAEPNYCVPVTNMTAMHWLAYQNDHLSLKILLKNGGDQLIETHDGLLPIDVAGTTPSWICVDELLQHYSDTQKLPKPRAYHQDFSPVDQILNFKPN